MAGNTGILLERKWVMLIRTRGAACEECGTPYNWNKQDPNLQFAHVKPTGVNGMSRGKWKRYYDIMRHPFHYRLLCKACHRALDGPEIYNAWRRKA